VAAPLIVRLVMDAAGYLKTVDTAVASNTKLEQSSLGVGEAMQVSANKSVNASLRATEALKAQIAGYRELAASAEQSAAIRERAALLANRAEGRLNSQLGLTAALSNTSTAAKTGERDLGKFTRGALAGSGAASSLGRSLAFASTGFIAIAGASTIIASSIKAAISLEKTQRQVATQLKTSGKSWQDYGQQIDAADLKLSHISGFTNQELLQGFGYLVRVNGNVSESLKLTAEAADVARGRNISLASAAIALAKAQGGSVTALRRLGIVVPKGLEGLKALAFVQEKFAGQAAAGATVSDKFRASLVNTEEIIGTALLPTFTRLTTEIGNWLAKMNETGRLQRDVNEVVTIGGNVFHTLGAAVNLVDRATGSFGKTLQVVLAIKLGFLAANWITSLKALAAEWGLVGAAATTAGAEQEAAVGAGAASAAAGAGAATGVAARVAAYTGGATAARAATIGRAGLGIGAAALTAGDLFTPSPRQYPGFKLVASGSGGATYIGPDGRYYIAAHGGAPIPIGGSARFSPPPISGSFTSFGGRFGPPQSPPSGFGLGSRAGVAAQAQGPFGTATPLAVYSKYTQTITEQIAVAQAALSKTTKDDVSAARRIIARIKRLIDQGHLQGTSLIQALQDEATQQGVLDSARQKAAQQAAKIAAAKLAAASSYTTPIGLQIAEVRAQLTKSTADDIAVEKRILAAAKAALASGSKNKQGQLAALQVILQAQQAIQSLTSQSATTFTQPLKLQLALAKAQATGGDQTPILLRMKAALEKALKAAKGNIQKQIDIYNQIAAINQQLNSSTTTAYGDFKKASVKAQTAGLGLTAAQRRALEQRLSQRGPGGTVPGTGTGAGGFIIGPDGRPIHRHRRPHYGRPGGGDGGSPPKFEATFNVRVYLDGKDVTRAVTVHQQRHRRRNPSSRRGPHAGSPTS
jgi:hypothetical protein